MILFVKSFPCLNQPGEDFFLKRYCWKEVSGVVE